MLVIVFSPILTMTSSLIKLPWFIPLPTSVTFSGIVTVAFTVLVSLLFKAITGPTVSILVISLLLVITDSSLNFISASNVPFPLTLVVFTSVNWLNDPLPVLGVLFPV